MRGSRTILGVKWFWVSSLMFEGFECLDLPRPQSPKPSRNPVGRPQFVKSYAWTVGVPNNGPLGGENFLSLRTVRASHPPASSGPGLEQSAI